MLGSSLWCGPWLKTTYVLSAQRKVGLLTEPVKTDSWSPAEESEIEPLTLSVKWSASVRIVPAGTSADGVYERTPSVSRSVPSPYTPLSVKSSGTPEGRVARSSTAAASGLSDCMKITAQSPA